MNFARTPAVFWLKSTSRVFGDPSLREAGGV